MKGAAASFDDEELSVGAVDFNYGDLARAQDVWSRLDERLSHVDPSIAAAWRFQTARREAQAWCQLLGQSITMDVIARWTYAPEAWLQTQMMDIPEEGRAVGVTEESFERFNALGFHDALLRLLNTGLPATPSSSTAERLSALIAIADGTVRQGQAVRPIGDDLWAELVGDIDNKPKFDGILSLVDILKTISGPLDRLGAFLLAPAVGRWVGLTHPCFTLACGARRLSWDGRFTEGSFALRAAMTAGQLALSRMDELQSFYAQAELKIRTFRKKAPVAPILDVLAERPVFSTRFLEERLDINIRRAQEIARELEAIGLTRIHHAWTSVGKDQDHVKKIYICREFLGIC